MGAPWASHWGTGPSRARARPLPLPHVLGELCGGGRLCARRLDGHVSYTRGWWTGQRRQDPAGTVVPVLEAMWVETSYNGTAMLASRVRLARATAVHKWLVNTKFPGSLYEFTVARGGEPDSRGSSELELREMLSSTRTEHVRHGLGGMAKELLQESPILRKVFSGPTLVWNTFFSEKREGPAGQAGGRLPGWRGRPRLDLVAPCSTWRRGRWEQRRRRRRRRRWRRGQGGADTVGGRRRVGRHRGRDRVQPRPLRA